jgi:hypothetical protein
MKQILPPILYGFKNRSPTLSEEHKSQVSENKFSGKYLNPRGEKCVILDIMLERA